VWTTLAGRHRGSDGSSPLHTLHFKGATSQFVYIEKFSLIFSDSSFVFHVNLLHPLPSLLVYGLSLSLWCFSILLNCYFQLSLTNKEAEAVMCKHNRHLRKQGKGKKEERAPGKCLLHFLSVLKCPECVITVYMA